MDTFGARSWTEGKDVRYRLGLCHRRCAARSLLEHFDSGQHEKCGSSGAECCSATTSGSQGQFSFSLFPTWGLSNIAAQVAAFIFIELVTFPLGCGIVLDICTVWLFPEASLVSRVVFFSQAPLTAMFYHWVAGTMFMYVVLYWLKRLSNLVIPTRYSFAVLLSGCRSIMRPGAMWFIKDPQDQNSHPIRDILDRPTFTQLRKIFVSGLMYAFVVACVVGSVAGLLLVGSKSIMPFRWKNR